MSNREAIDALIAASTLHLSFDGKVSTDVVQVGADWFSVVLERWHDSNVLATVRRHECPSDKGFALFSERTGRLCEEFNRIRMGGLVGWDGSHE